WSSDVCSSDLELSCNGGGFRKIELTAQGIECYLLVHGASCFRVAKLVIYRKFKCQSSVSTRVGYPKLPRPRTMENKMARKVACPPIHRLVMISPVQTSKDNLFQHLDQFKKESYSIVNFSIQGKK